MRALSLVVASLLAIGCSATPSNRRVAVPHVIEKNVEIAAPTSISAPPRSDAALSALPPGWIEGSGALVVPDAAPSKTSRQALLDWLTPRRRIAVATSIDIASLPLFEAPKRNDAIPMPSVSPPPGLEIAADIDVGPREKDSYASGISVLVGPKNPRFGRIDSARGQSYVTKEGSAHWLSCGGVGSSRMSALHWEGLTPTADGLAFDAADGFWDHVACKPFVARRWHGLAKAIVPGLVYAFRTSCKGCDGERLHVFTPRVDDVSTASVSGSTISDLAHLDLPLREGDAASAVISITPGSLVEFGDAIDVKHALEPKTTIIEIEVSRAVGEREATGVVSVSKQAI